MSPERVRFHALLLEMGEQALLDRELAEVLETEEPLSELTLALSVCGSREETLHVLHEHLLDHPADEAAVERLVREELCGRYERGAITAEKCLSMMKASACEDLRLDVMAVEEYRDMAAEGIIHEETATLCLDALLKGESLPDAWVLDKAIRRAKKRGEAYPGQEHPGIVAIPLDNPGESATIGKQSISQRRTPVMLRNLKSKFIGDKAFYRAVLVILLPLVVQQGITSFVNLLDTLMVGSLGEETLSAVGVVNQILMVFNLTIFGGLSGVSIFGSQFAGKGDVDGMRQSFRTKLYFGAAVCVIGIGVLVMFGERFIALFMEGELNAAGMAYLGLKPDACIAAAQSAGVSLKAAGFGSDALAAKLAGAAEMLGAALAESGSIQAESAAIAAISAQRVVFAMGQAQDYLTIMLFGLPAFVLSQAYTGSMREMGKTVATMVGSIIAILTNLVLNFLLIFPTREMSVLGWTFTMWGAGWGVSGAAVATVISRVVEMVFVVIYAHLHQNRYVFLRGAFRNGYVPLSLLRRIAITGTPLLLNEVLWSLGMTFINQCYSRRGMTALAALNITSTAWNLFCIIMFAMGNAVSIMVGQYLGRGDKKGAREVDTKLLFITVVSHIALGGLLALLAGAIPMMFNVTAEARDLAKQTLVIAGLSLPIHAFLHATYFTIRSGGKTVVTFLFDSVYTWCVPAVLAFVLSRFTQADVVTMYFCIQFIDVVKLVIGLFMLRSDFWANNVVDAAETTEA